MRAIDAVIIALAGIGVMVLPIAAERTERERIINNCRVLGVIELDGVVIKCREKLPKP